MYDVVISYHNEIESIAKRIFDYLSLDGMDVFFAPEFQQEMVSEKLHVKLYDVYKNQSYIKLLLVSPKYDKSEWTQLEKRMALESTKSDPKRLVIVNYTGEELMGDLSSLVYMDGKKYMEDQIAAFISERIRSRRKEPDCGRSEFQSSAWGKSSSNINTFINNGVSIANHGTMGNINISK